MTHMAGFTLLLLAPCLISAAKVTPVQQVLGMLEDMRAKGEKAMEAEKKVFADYAVWVEDVETGQITKLSQEIDMGKRAASKLAASVEKAESDVSGLKSGIAKLDGEIADMEAEKKAVVAQRAEEHAEYKKISAEYQESGDAVAMAIQQLSNQNFNRPQAMMQLQKMAGKAKGARRVLAALLQMDESKAPEIAGPPEVAAYEFNAGGLIETLEQLQQKFQKQLSESESVESNAAHAFALQVQHLDDLLAESKSDREEKAGVKAQRSGDSRAAQSELADTKSDVAEDEKTLSDVKVTFTEKKSQFEANQKARGEELEALGKAIEIISSPTVSGLVQEKPVNFLQQRSLAASKRSLARGQAVELLREKTKALSSTVLATAALELSKNSNPFAKITDMIKGMLQKLKDEASEEADHKAFCDKELKQNKRKRDKRSMKFGTLTAEAEELEGTIQSMAAEMAQLSKEQADLADAMSTATAQRQKEKSKNTDTIQDAKAARSAVKKALAVLNDFYSNQALVQTGKRVPEMEAYGVMTSSSNGVVGMLEVIETDFARLDSETTAEESMAASSYEKFMSDATADKKRKHDHEFKLSLKKDQKEFELEQGKKALGDAKEELDQADAYFKELKPKCTTVHVSYEERKARREEEIESLKGTYETLNSASA